MEEESMAKSGKPKALRRVVLFFLLSVLSFHSYPSLLQLLMVDVSSLERKAIFLVFNFILLFLAKDSGLLSTPSTAERRRRRIDDIDATAKDKHVANTDDCAAIQVEEKMAQVDQEISKATSSSSSSFVELVVVEEFVEEDGEGSSVDVDELNRRCEEFIEMVKRTRQMEACLAPREEDQP
ncbi:hypothetical protein M6B38_365460 [Iris pallida]|uniref:Uncharacterized protein n=1 Tax=Iris pallida TaxID=29817 RepID=A0AAX6GHX0_IRIPA|nr:hypothetical protein M6B38_365460 [Iris pallida]